jgi:ABC-2 type transport system ATP-binding protein
MRRRLDLAMSLVGDPRIIFLDEPTAGLDPRGRRTVWQIIRDLVAGGVTVFLTTQYLEEADQLADRIAVLDHGRLVAEGTAAELKRRIPGGHIRLRFTDAGGLDAAARALGHRPERLAGWQGASRGGQPVDHRPERLAGWQGASRGGQPVDVVSRDEDALTLQVPSDGGVRSLRALLDRLDGASIEVAELSVHTPDLDDVFLSLTDRTDNVTARTDKAKVTTR